MLIDQEIIILGAINMLTQQLLIELICMEANPTKMNVIIVTLGGISLHLICKSF